MAIPKENAQDFITRDHPQILKQIEQGSYEAGSQILSDLVPAYRVLYLELKNRVPGSKELVKKGKAIIDDLYKLISAYSKDPSAVNQKALIKKYKEHISFDEQVVLPKLKAAMTDKEFLKLGMYLKRLRRDVWRG